MHEGKFTEQIVAVILEEIAKFPGKKPKSVKVKVGEVFHLIPESVQLHYDLQVKGTPLEGVSLQLQEEAIEVECLACQTRGPVEDHHLLVCSKCYSRQVKVLKGQQIQVEAIEVEG